MTTRIYDGNSSKQEELEALTRLARVFKSGSYLYDFFTPALLNWLASQIRDDVSPDLMQSHEHLFGEIAQLSSRLAQAQARLDDEKKAGADFEKVAQEERTRLQDVIEAKNERINDLRESITHWQEIVDNADLNRRQAESETAELRDEIIRLKAKLYDLTEKLDNLTDAAGAA